MSNKLLVVGLDGACWNLIDDWIEEGHLPTIAKLKKNGSWGDMESTIPPVTCPAWKSYSTGKNPGKLGVYWWNSIDFERKKIVPSQGSMFKSKEIWDILNDYGYRTGVIGMPLTYPPKELDGFMVSGGLDALEDGYTYPKSLQNELEEELAYSLHPSAAFAGEVGEEEIENVLKVIEDRFRAAKYLIDKEEVDFLQVTTFYLNSPLQHFYYDGEPVLEAWKRIDGHIKDLKDQFENVILMSDHGTAYVEKDFYLNAWLKKKGYLKRRLTFKDILFKSGLNIQNLVSILEKLKLKNKLSESKLAWKIGELFPEKIGTTRGRGGEATLEGVKWDETRVVALPQGPVYINEADMSQKEYEEFREELIDELKSIKETGTDNNVFQGVYKPEEIYEGDKLEKAPDILTLDSDEYHNRGGMLKHELFNKSGWKGNNASHGLCLFDGPGFEKGKQINNIEILDLAPTILNIFSIPRPKQLDGKVIGKEKDNSTLDKKSKEKSEIDNNISKLIDEDAL